ncbi:MAG: uL14 family ribosomal protein [Candidatus Micrarchaeaceae archaeon]|jgi:large subunit ribosomal protein L14|nr:50S ribosomal protein L14 [Candidatus Micrarchaeota archaeon]HII10392.1 50S ribosomal protein L14 [Candidatus Micrarchaeota archaeon]
MKGLSTTIPKNLIPSSVLTCADNSGARTLMIINRIGKGGGRKGRYSKSGICDVVIASVKSGTPQYVKKKVRVMIIRQKSPIRRANGMRVRFEDNAGILVTESNLAVGTEVKGAMAREVVERYVKLAGIASRVV